ncbi:MAG TPA: 16S rRNA (cytidine(1402)-2'-O)-methyltransferase [Actinomycetota bacterium]|nr:16S rRNA (cytidine(1402)-2'-O)-methyltransferase [Actinomycetota bacterium]
MTGSLIIVATPIGNLDDLSPRAAKALAEADLIACEDTRVTRKLLTRVAGSTPMMSYRSANEAQKAAELVARIEAGETVALVTDAGTPGVSDPGHLLVDACAQRGIPINVVPGPSAAVAALVASGLPTARFVFEGFLPHTRTARRKRLEALAREERTLVLFEAPHRLKTTLADISDVLGDRRIAMAREMTKIHEEFFRSTVSGLQARVGERGVKGEVTLVIEGAPDHGEEKQQFDDADLVEMVRARIGAGASRRDAIDFVADETGLPRRRVYQATIDAKV